MKIAILASGQIRNYQTTWQKSIENLTNQLEYDIYLDTWDENGTTSAIDRVISKDYLHYFIGDIKPNNYDPLLFEKNFPKIYSTLFKKHKLDRTKLESTFKTKNIKLEEIQLDFEKKQSLFDITYPTNLQTLSPRGFYTIPMFYKMNSCLEMAINSGIDYDVYIRIRPDFHLDKPLNIEWGDIGNKLLVRDVGGRRDYIDDQFAIGSLEQIKKYCSVWQHLKSYWSTEENTKNLFGGTLLKYHLDQQNANISYQKDWNQFLASDKVSKNDLQSIVFEQLKDCDHISEAAHLIDLYDELYAEDLQNRIVKSKQKKQLIELESIKVQKFSNRNKNLAMNKSIAFLLERKNEYFSSYTHYKNSLASDELSYFSHMGCYRTLKQLRKDERALAHLFYATAIRPNDWLPTREIGYFYSRAGNNELALNFLDIALNKNPKDKALQKNILQLKKDTK